MFGFFKNITVNWSNLVENLIILIVVGATTGILSYRAGYHASLNATERVIERVIPTIEKAIDKETIANTITNAIEVSVDKIKKSDSLNINLQQAPHNDLKPTNTIKSEPKQKEPEKKKGFFRRIFG